MSGKNLTFKLVMDADTKNFVGNIKQAEKTINETFKAIQEGRAEFVSDSKAASDALSNLVPDNLQKKADQAKGKLGEVAQAASALEVQASQASSKIDGLGSELQDTAATTIIAGLFLYSVPQVLQWVSVACIGFLHALQYLIPISSNPSIGWNNQFDILNAELGICLKINYLLIWPEFPKLHRQSSELLPFLAKYPHRPGGTLHDCK